MLYQRIQGTPALFFMLYSLLLYCHMWDFKNFCVAEGIWTDMFMKEFWKSYLETRLQILKVIIIFEPVQINGSTKIAPLATTYWSRTLHPGLFPGENITNGKECNGYFRVGTRSGILRRGIYSRSMFMHVEHLQVMIADIYWPMVYMDLVTS